MPFVAALIAGCVGLHYYNGEEQTKRDEEEELLERLKANRRVPRPPRPGERAALLARKKAQLAGFEAEQGADAARHAARLSVEIRALEGDEGGT